jgi:hypothetical protein
MMRNVPVSKALAHVGRFHDTRLDQSIARVVAAGEMPLEFCLVGQQTVQTAVQARVVDLALLDPQQVVGRGGGVNIIYSHAGDQAQLAASQAVWQKLKAAGSQRPAAA